MSPESPSPRPAALALLERVARIHANGWCTGTAGNFSVTIGRDPLRLWITRSGVDKARLSEDDLLLVGPDGLPVDPADRDQRPSAETALHIMLAREAGAAAILHSHSVWNTLLGERFLERGGFRISGYEMLKGIDGVRSHDAEVFVPVVENSQELEKLAESMQRRIDQHPDLRGMLIAGHGLYAWGDSLVGACRHLEVFEFLFELAGRRVPLVPFEG